MAFINEYIPPDDFEKYNISELQLGTAPVKMYSDDWAIDRESGSWLYFYGMGFDRDDGGFNGDRYWYFFWRNHLIKIKTEVINRRGGGVGQPYTATHKVLSIDCPSSHEINRDEMLLDFQTALSVYGPRGMSTRPISSKVELVN